MIGKDEQAKGEAFLSNSRESPYYIYSYYTPLIVNY